jgi:hypothetical protein
MDQIIHIPKVMERLLNWGAEPMGSKLEEMDSGGRTRLMVGGGPHGWKRARIGGGWGNSSHTNSP